MLKSKKANQPKLWEGIFYWYDIDTLPKFNVKELKEEWNGRKLTRGNIIPNPQQKNEIVIFDLPEDDDFYADSVRGFIYEDGKFMGKLKRGTKNQVQEVDELTGVYKKTSKKLAVQGVCEERNGAKDYFYFELIRPKT